MYDRRFASLRGRSRRFLDESEAEEEELFDLGIEELFDEPLHDGWSAIRPLRSSSWSAYESGSWSARERR